MKNSLRNIVLLIPFLLTGCSLTQKISYETKDLGAYNKTGAIPIAVEVRMFTDTRAEVPEHKVVFTKKSNEVVLDDEWHDDKRYCVNVERHYKKDSVSAEVTGMLVKHINQTKLFSRASYQGDEKCDYYLVGNLRSFYGEQEYSYKAAVASQFGLIGAVVASTATTPGTIRIELTDLKLFKKSGELVKDMGNFSKLYSEELSADAHCWCIYWNMNEKLKDFNSHLVAKIKNDLASVQF
jgi:hypothetical protein